MDARVRAILSEPLHLPDPFVSWMTQTISAYTLSTPTDLKKV